LIDEAMGSLIFINHEVYKQVETRKGTIPPNVLNMHGLAMFTASMNVRFQKPLVTPQVVLATATLKKIDNRKVFLEVTVKN
jgi:acyl-CoA thioesterase FadM